MNISQLRKEVNLTQEDLAKELGLSLKTITNWEGGKVRITEAKQAKLLEFFADYKKRNSNLVEEFSPQNKDEVQKILIGQSQMSVEVQNAILKSEVMRLKAILEEIRKVNESE